MLITRKILIVFVLVSLAIGFGGGFAFHKYHLAANTSLPILRNLINKDVGQPEDLDFSLFWEVWSTLHKKYVDPGKLDTQKLLNGAISGMVDAVGDPYTVFFEPVTSQKFQEEISGSFGGVGMELGKRDGALTVIAPIPDSPAAHAGIKSGDKLVAINKESALELSVEAAVNKIRGEKGTKVNLTMARPGQSGTFDVELTREAIKIPSIEWKQIGDVAYLQIITFNGNVQDDFEKAAKEILKSNSKKLIVDVRNNPGGLLDAAINIAGWFIDKNQIVVSEEFRDKSLNSFEANGNAALKIFPTVMLINGGSASASEILAGALHDNRDIRLVGEKSFGKGSVQELSKFLNGSSLKVTIAKWLTPKGVSITDHGISADIEVKIPEKTEGLEFGTPGKDPQLDKALELLK